ncbi:MAG: TCR/Tet family MFS transporter [Planctomycetaceae bacterium]
MPELASEINGKKPRKAAIIFIFFTLLIDIIGIGIVIPVLPELIKDLLHQESPGLSLRELTSAASLWGGIIGASYAVTQFFFAPIVGALSDRFGRRPILLLAMAGLAVDYVIQANAPTLLWLFVGRVVAGIMGASFTTANAYIADISTDETRARNFGLLGAAFGLGFAIGPALGGLLGSYSLRLPFWVSAGLALVNFLYGLFVLPESLAPENRSPFTASKMNPLASLLRLRKYPVVAGLAVAILFVSLAQRGLENVWVFHSSYRYGWDELTNGLALGLVGIMAIIVQGGMVRPMIKRLGERNAVLFGMGIAFLAFMGYAFASQGWMVYCVIIFGSIGGIAGPAVQSIVAKSVDPSEQGQMQGAITSLRSVTSIFAPLIFTSGLFSYFTSDKVATKLPGIPFFVRGLCQLVALFIAYRLFQRIGQPKAEEPKSDLRGTETDG